MSKRGMTTTMAAVTAIVTLIVGVVIGIYASPALISPTGVVTEEEYNALKSDFDAANNNSSTPSGRILTLWNTHSVALLKLAESEQFIHFEVQP